MQEQVNAGSFILLKVELLSFLFLVVFFLFPSSVSIHGKAILKSMSKYTMELRGCVGVCVGLRGSIVHRV